MCVRPERRSFSPVRSVDQITSDVLTWDDIVWDRFRWDVKQVFVRRARRAGDRLGARDRDNLYRYAAELNGKAAGIEAEAVAPQQPVEPAAQDVERHQKRQPKWLPHR